MSKGTSWLQPSEEDEKESLLGSVDEDNDSTTTGDPEGLGVGPAFSSSRDLLGAFESPIRHRTALHAIEDSEEEEKGEEERVETPDHLAARRTSPSGATDASPVSPDEFVEAGSLPYDTSGNSLP